MSDEQCFATSPQRWHERLGHTNFRDNKRLSHHVSRILVEEEQRRAVPKDVTRSTEVMDIEHKH